MTNFYLELLKSCIAAVGANMRDDEAIVQVRQGKTIFSRNTTIPFLVDIASVNGEIVSNPRALVAYVESNPPHNVQSLVDTYEKLSWVPLL